MGGAAPEAWGAQAAERRGAVSEARNVPDSIFLIFMPFEGGRTSGLRMVAGTAFLPSPSRVPQGTKFTQCGRSELLETTLPNGETEA